MLNTISANFAANLYLSSEFFSKTAQIYAENSVQENGKLACLIQRHLVKCRRNHPDAEVVICKFNSSHHIPLREEQYHLQTCQDRKFIEMMKYGLRLEEKKQVPFKPATRPLMIQGRKQVSCQC